MADQTSSAPGQQQGQQQPIRFDTTTTSAAVDGNGATGATLRCGKCVEAIGAYYYEAAGVVYCARCKRQSEEQQASSAGGMMRGALFGIGGALAGAIGYFAVTVLSGWNIGFVALGVAWVVSTAVRKGTRGTGGQPVQILCVALTAVAVTLANLGFDGFPPSIMNVVIAGIALRYAWQLGAGMPGTTPDGRLAFTGPYKVAAPRPTAPAA